ncbi:MAG TPA: hypothetical protein VNT30_01035 [Stellaceae bacterium]|nr:hypothetical protein [Stellaceae bacterium]
MRQVIVPAVIFGMAMLLTVKLGDAWQHAGEAFAQSKPTPPAAAPSASNTPAAATPSPATTPSLAATPATPAGNGKPSGAPVSAALAEADPAATDGRAGKPKRNASFSPAEVEILQALSERRATLDRQTEELDRRQGLLRAAEQRVDEKIAKLQSIQQTIDGLLKKYDQQEDTKITSLVHIYESMKPKDAARIFEQLDMPVLMEVLERMKDLKTAPILASMDPTKARTVTIALAERRQLPTVNQ